MTAQVKSQAEGKEKQEEVELTKKNIKSLDALIPAVIKGIDESFDWNEVKKVVVNTESTV